MSEPWSGQWHICFSFLSWFLALLWTVISMDEGLGEKVSITLTYWGGFALIKCQGWNLTLANQIWAPVKLLLNCDTWWLIPHLWILSRHCPDPNRPQLLFPAASELQGAISSPFQLMKDTRLLLLFLLWGLRVGDLLLSLQPMTVKQ